MGQFEQILAFADDDAMQKKWKAFCMKTDTSSDDYGTVLRTIKAFLKKPYGVAVEYLESIEKLKK